MILPLPSSTNMCLPVDFLYWMAVSNTVRFFDHGIQFYSANTDQVANSPSFPCKGINNGLCQHDKYRFFYCSSDMLRYRSWNKQVDEDKQLSMLWDETMSDNNECKNRVTSLLSNSYHDVNMCDLSSMSVVFINNKIQILHDPWISTWIYWVYVFLMIILTLYLSESIASMFNDSNSYSYSVISSVLCILTIVFAYFTTNISFFVTIYEQWLFVYISIYVVLYAIHHLEHKITINMILATLLLLISRLHNTFEHIYCIPIVFLISVRLMQKVHIYYFGSIMMSNDSESNFVLDRLQFLIPDNASSSNVKATESNTRHYFFMILDVILLTFVYYVGISDAFRDSSEPGMNMVGIVFISWVAAKMLTEYVSHAVEKHD